MKEEPAKCIEHYVLPCSTISFLYLLTNWDLFGADLPANLYPTVGLQTPGEVIDANFGQEPFLFDIEGEMRAIRRKTRSTFITNL
jgi:hypothetical protein